MLESDCLPCAVKHVGVANIFLEEAQLRSPDDARSRVLKAYHHLSHASDIHLAEKYPELASTVRNFRKSLEACAFHGKMPCPPEGAIKQSEMIQQELLSHIKKVPCANCEVPRSNKNSGAILQLFSSKKPIIGEPQHTNNPRRKMPDWRRAGTVTGFSFLGKVLERGFVEVDKATAMQVNPPHMRPSTWLNVALGLGGLVAGSYRVASDPIDLGLMVWGAHHLTKLTDYVEEYAAPTARVRRIMPTASRFTPVGTPVARAIF